MPLNTLPVGGLQMLLTVTTSQTFGPYSMPDDRHLLRFKLARCTALRPTLWSDPLTKVRITGTLLMAGVTHETFSPDTFTGGVVSGKDGAELAWTAVTIGPCPLLCTVCGERFHPGQNAYARSLLHSTISLNPGKSLPFGGVLADYKRRIVPNDEAIFTRTFHNPALTPNLAGDRTVKLLVELISGPPLVTELSLEVL